VVESPKRRRQACEADDGVEDDVRPRALEQLRQVSADLRQRRKPVNRLRSGRGGDELEVRIRGDDVERLAPDGAGHAQDDDSPHLASVGSAP
jgi:hypothetical protein